MNARCSDFAKRNGCRRIEFSPLKFQLSIFFVSPPGQSFYLPSTAKIPVTCNILDIQICHVLTIRWIKLQLAAHHKSRTTTDPGFQSGY